MKVTKNLFEQIMSAASLQRWTDHIRPLDLTAMGKHAHTMAIAWVIGRTAEYQRPDLWKIDWDYLIRAGLYELLRVSLLTDIKAPLLDELRSNEADWKAINADLIVQINEADVGLPLWMAREMAEYWNGEHPSDYAKNAAVIYNAASALATHWEYRIIRQANSGIHDLLQTESRVTGALLDYQYVPGVKDIAEARNGLSTFSDLCGRLRFQLRWSQTPILPPRPVLDHELAVAYVAYLAIVDEPSAPYTRPMWERYQAFFGGLFHDLPEVLTRDVVSPVKQIADGKIEKILDRTELEWFDREFRRMLPLRMYHELKFFAVDEFDEKTWPPNDWPSHLQQLDPEREGAAHHGKLIKNCDLLGAFEEARASVNHGTTSKILEKALKRGTDVIMPCRLTRAAGIRSLIESRLSPESNSTEQ